MSKYDLDIANSWSNANQIEVLNTRNKMLLQKYQSLDHDQSFQKRFKFRT